MAELSNPRHERFAQLLVEGNAADMAYAEAGYQPNRGNAIRMKANENVKARVAELQKRAGEKHDVTVAGVVKNLVDLGDKAATAGQFGPAIRAHELIGKTIAAFTDSYKDDSSKMTDEAMVEAIRQLAGDDAAAKAMQRLRNSKPDRETLH